MLGRFKCVNGWGYLKEGRVQSVKESGDRDKAGWEVNGWNPDKVAAIKREKTSFANSNQSCLKVKLDKIRECNGEFSVLWKENEELAIFANERFGTIVNLVSFHLDPHWPLINKLEKK